MIIFEFKVASGILIGNEQLSASDKEQSSANLSK